MMIAINSHIINQFIPFSVFQIFLRGLITTSFFNLLIVIYMLIMLTVLSYYFQLISWMLFCKFAVIFAIVFLLLSSIGHGETIVLNGAVSNGSGGNSIPSKVVALTSIDEIEGSTDYMQILRMLGVPGYSWSHGYNYIALGSWSCEGGAGSVLRLWMQPTKYVGTVLGVSDVESRAALKALYRKAGIAILVNAFSSFYNPVSGGNFSASECADRLYSFVRSYDLDGVNIDFRDNVASKEGKSLKWLT